ncbi:MAG: hypothetical protein HWE27_05830 [Gammaproteobacteria bacterium]|nr:hypothetical protein [Gammaproteobacteria bacterium]
MTAHHHKNPVKINFVLSLNNQGMVGVLDYLALFLYSQLKKLYLQNKQMVDLIAPHTPE